MIFPDRTPNQQRGGPRRLNAPQPPMRISPQQQMNLPLPPGQSPPPRQNTQAPPMAMPGAPGGGRPQWANMGQFQGGLSGMGQMIHMNARPDGNAINPATGLPYVHQGIGRSTSSSSSSRQQGYQGVAPVMPQYQFPYYG